MNTIPFTQYIRPNGRKIKTGIARPKKIYDKAQKIIDKGYRFEAEVLITGHVSLTIVDKKGKDVDIEVVKNGPEVAIAVDALINRFKMGYLKRRYKNTDEKN